MKGFDILIEAYGNFPSKYEVKDDKIIVEMADGSNQVIPWSLNSEKELLKTMEGVARYAKFSIKKLKERKKRYIIAAICQGVFSSLGCGYLKFMVEMGDKNYTIGALTTGLLALSTLAHGIKAAKDGEGIKDYEKNVYYLNNKEDYWMAGIEHKYLKTNLPWTKKMQLKRDGNKEFNVNVINNYSLEDLKMIRENIDFYRKYADQENKYDKIKTKK